MRGRLNADTPPSPAEQRTTSERRRPRPDPGCGNCDGRGCMSCVFREVHDRCEDDCPSCCTSVAATHPNATAYTSAAVACPDEPSARRHRDRATWWEPYRVERHERAGQWIGSTVVRAGRRWTR